MHETQNDVCTNICILYITQLSKIQKASRIMYYTMCIYYTHTQQQQTADKYRIEREKTRE